MKKVLIINGEIPLPVNSGGKRRTWNYISSLFKDCELSLLCLYHEPITEETRAEMHEYFKNTWTLYSKQRDVYYKNDLVRRFSMFCRGIPWDLYGRFRKDFNEKIAEILDKNMFDAIIVRYMNQAQYLVHNRDKIKCKVIFDIDDIEPKKIERELGVSRFKNTYDRFRKKLNNRMFEDYHRKYLRLFDACVVCSREDETFLRNRRWTDRITVIPNAVDVGQFNVAERKPPYDTILFCGVLDYKPNEDAIVWFVDEVFPLILAQRSDTKLLIVGRTPSPAVEALAKHKNIRLHANVPSMKPYYDESAAVVVPIRIAGGTRVKILEAAACRRPVVSTTVGAEGLDLKHREHCLVGDTKEGLAKQCVNALNDPKLADRLVEANYRFVKEHYDISAVQERIRRLVL